MENMRTKLAIDSTSRFMTLTYAQSLDGCISAARGAPLRLSGEESMMMTHKIRGMHDAIMVGIGTVLADNPSLTVRLVSGVQPLFRLHDGTGL